MSYKPLVIYLEKCFVCGEIQEYIYRDTCVNPGCDDSQVNSSMNRTAGELSCKYCETCKNPCTFQRVGWKVEEE